MDDAAIETRIADLENRLQSWLQKNDLWFQCRFYLEDDEPEESPEVRLLGFNNTTLLSVFDGQHPDTEALLTEFDRLVSDCGFEWSLFDYTTVSFRPSDELREPFYDYFRFRWISSLLLPACADVTDEIFAHFRDKPDALRKIEPRGLETLLDAIFRNQGFRTELGPGSADGGVDLRLYQHDVIGEVQTLVQVKRYAEHRPIDLDLVSALEAHVRDQKANRGLFVTTSRFLRGARKFSARQGRIITLAATDDMVRWCDQVQKSLATTRSSEWLGTFLDRIRRSESFSGIVGKIVHGTWGYNMTHNDFAVVVREAASAVLLAPIRSRKIASGQTGTEVAELVLRDVDEPRTFVARRHIDQQGREYFSGKRRLYEFWDGTPQYYNYLD